MLEFLRNKSSSWMAKGILGAIVLSFCYYGLSGVFQSTSKSHMVATVGDTDISKHRLASELKRAIMAFQKETGKKLSMQELYGAGIVHQLLERMINTALIEEEIKRLNITTPDDIVLDVIQKDTVFSETGKFSRQKFDRILAANKMTEAQYINTIRQKLAEVQLLSTISAAGYVPQPLLHSFFSTFYEKRQVSIVVPKIMLDASKVTDADIQKFYDASKEKFRTPEYRNFKVLILDPAALTKQIKITEADVKTAYEQQKENFYDEARRDILMIRVQDKKEAASVKALIQQGKVETFADKIPLKGVTQGDMPDEDVAEIAFKLPVGGISEMVSIPSMGQNFVIYVQKILPGGLKPFDQVKSQVLEDLRGQKAMDAMANLTHTIEDKLAANVTFAQLAKEHHLKLVEVQGANAEGVLKSGQKVPAGVTTEILRTAFETRANMDSPIVEMEDAPLFVVHVDTVEASTIPPLASIKDRVKHLLIQKLEMENSIAKTHEMIAALKAGKTIAEIAKVIPSVVHTFTIDTSDPKSHDKLDKQSIARLFSLGEGGHTTISFANQFALGQVVKITPANAQTDKNRFNMIKKVLTVSNNEEIIHQYFSALREKHGVRIYKESIESLILVGEAAAPSMPVEMPM